jgi:hypothetical protein
MTVAATVERGQEGRGRPGPLPRGLRGVAASEGPGGASAAMHPGSDSIGELETWGKREKKPAGAR